MTAQFENLINPVDFGGGLAAAAAVTRNKYYVGIFRQILVHSPADTYQREQVSRIYLPKNATCVKSNGTDSWEIHRWNEEIKLSKLSKLIKTSKYFLLQQLSEKRGLGNMSG